jgi:hypothetical protein
MGAWLFLPEQTIEVGTLNLKEPSPDQASLFRWLSAAGLSSGNLVCLPEEISRADRFRYENLK